MPRQQLLLVTLAFEGGLFLLALAFGWALDYPFWQVMEVSGAGLALALGATVPMVLGAILLSEFPFGPFRQVSDDFDMIVGLFKKASITDLLAISLLAGLGEEALFRGVIQPLAIDYLGLWGGLAVASVVFGLAHLISPAYFVFATLLGFYLGGVYLWADSLTVAILVHALYDFAALVYGVKIVARQA